MALLTTCALINRVGGPARLSEIGGAPYKRQLTLSIQGQLKSGTESTKKTFFQKEDSSKLPHLNVHHAVPALLGGTALAAPLIFPAPVFAAAEQAAAQVTTTLTATTPQFSHTYHMVDDHTMCMGCMVLGTTFSVLTLATTGRFILSLYVAFFFSLLFPNLTHFS